MKEKTIKLLLTSTVLMEVSYFAATQWNGDTGVWAIILSVFTFIGSVVCAIGAATCEFGR